jgi:hypothetical protein
VPRRHGVPCMRSGSIQMCSRQSILRPPEDLRNVPLCQFACLTSNWTAYLCGKGARIATLIPRSITVGNPVFVSRCSRQPAAWRVVAPRMIYRVEPTHSFAALSRSRLSFGFLPRSLHVRPENRVHAALILWTYFPKPFEDVAIDAKGNGNLGLRDDEYGIIPKVWRQVG